MLASLEILQKTSMKWFTPFFATVIESMCLRLLLKNIACK